MRNIRINKSGYVEIINEAVNKSNAEHQITSSGPYKFAALNPEETKIACINKDYQMEIFEYIGSPRKLQQIDLRNYRKWGEFERFLWYDNIILTIRENDEEIHHFCFDSKTYVYIGRKE